MSIQTSPSGIIIRNIAENDRAHWEPLWRGYLDFYQKIVADEVTEFTWNRLTRTHEIEGFLVSKEAGDAVGLVQFLFHPTTFTRGENCYLEDLFVIPSARGQRIGRRLCLK